MQLFIVGTVGMIGSDDVLACFIAGNTFTWDDWFRQETLDDSLQPTIDMLLNVAVFIWFGAVCPWSSFVHNAQIPIYRLIFLGVLVLLLRRPPVVLLMHNRIHQIEEWRQALFVGFFGPIGVSAIFYLYVTLDYLRNNIEVDGKERADAERLGEILMIVVWFLVICSIVVHGLSIPLGKLGFYIPRTISIAISQETSEPAFHVPNSQTSSSANVAIPQTALGNAPNPVYRIGRSIIKPRQTNTRSGPASRLTSKRTTPKSSRPSSPLRNSAGLSSLTIERAMDFAPPADDAADAHGASDASDENASPEPEGHLGQLRQLGGGVGSSKAPVIVQSPIEVGSSCEAARPAAVLNSRSIRFPDEAARSEQ